MRTATRRAAKAVMPRMSVTEGASVSMVAGSGMSLCQKTGVLVEDVMVVAVAVAVAVEDGQNQRVEVKSLTGQLPSVMRTVLAGTVLLRGLGTLEEGAAIPEKKSVATE